MLAAALAVTGCSSSSSKSSNAAGAASGSFPVTVQGTTGSVTLKAKPTKIISLSPTATEDLFAIGAGKQVIAVDDQSNFPGDAPKTDLSGVQPNVEAIASRSPDLVVVSFDANNVVGGLTNLGIPVLVQGTAASLNDAYDQITALGKATGNVAGATKVVDTMKSQLADAAKQAKKAASPQKYFFEVDNTYYTATSKTFIGDVLAPLGLTNIADSADSTGSGFPQLSSEYIVGQNPDYIFFADSKCCAQTVQTVSTRPGWAEIAAVKNGRIVLLDDDIASRWGPRTPQLLEAASKATQSNG